MNTETAVTIALALIAGVTALTFWCNRPTETDKAIYTLGFNDGADGRDMETFDHPHNQSIYREAYRDGSRGRTRRADAERLSERTNGT